MGLFSRHIPEVFAVAIGLLLIATLTRWLLRQPALANSPGRSFLLKVAAGTGAALLLFGIATRSIRIARMFPLEVVIWAGTVALAIPMLLLVITFAILVLRLIPRSRAEHSAGRRLFLSTARSVVLAAPAATVGYGVFIQRTDLTTREVDLPVAGLAPELDGLRLVQLSDIHLSPFLSVRELERAVDMANGFRPHLALVTGDLISTARDPLDDCIRQLGRLKSDAGILGCLGNHEVYAKAEQYTEEQSARLGIDFLRSRSRVLTFKGKDLNFVGVDYQPMHSNYLVGCEKLKQPGMPNILLSHNPDVFPVAAAQGFDCTISGHTHGGQISVEILHQSLNVARFYTRYVYGIYRKGNSSIWVTRGIGTVGVPARLGAPPEVALIRLCAI